MKEPEFILESGTKVVTTTLDQRTRAAIFTNSRYLEARREGTKGKIVGFLAGHGGDIYWVEHGPNDIGAYGWWEFDLDSE